MNFYAASALFDAVVMSLLFLILIFKKNKPRVAKYFNIMNFFGIVWAISYYLWQTATSYDAALLWVKMLMIGAMFAAPAFFHFATVVTGREKDFLPITLINYGISLVFAYLNIFSDKFIGPLSTKLSLPFFPTAGEYYAYYLMQWAAILGFSCWILFNRAREVEENEKEFIEVLAISTIISFGAGSANYFLWYNIPVPPVTTLITSLYAIAVTILLFQGKFYKINLFYFEYFAGMTVSVSLLQFVLVRQLPQQYVSALIVFIILLGTLFLVRNSKNERMNLEKIKDLNRRLSESLMNMINSIDACVIIIDGGGRVNAVNDTALTIYGHKRDSYPKKFHDFVFGDTNKALVYSLDDYFETKKAATTTTVLSPEVETVDIFFSPFTLHEVNDSIMIIIKKHKGTDSLKEEKIKYEH